MYSPIILLLLHYLACPAALTPAVRCTSTSPAVLGGNVNLTCDFPYQLDVVQVTWQKKGGNPPQNLVTHSNRYGVHIDKSCKNHVLVLQADTTRSSISLTKLEEEDEACYLCLFNTYPNGAFTGEVCLRNLEPSNEVTCLGTGTQLNITMGPTEIMTRQSGQVIKSNPGESAILVQKGRYLDAHIHPVCTFQLQPGRRRKRSLQGTHKNLSEGLNEIIITQCSASGKQKHIITWHNEGNPVIREDKENTTSGIITVTRTLHHSVSSLSPDFKITCDITQEVPAISAAAFVNDFREEHKDDPRMTKTMLDKAQYCLGIRLGIICAAVLLLMSSFYGIHTRIRKSQLQKTQEDHLTSEATTPIHTPNFNYGSVTKRRESSTKKPTSAKSLSFQ